jgi:biopolymer transport protein ExbD
MIDVMLFLLVFFVLISSNVLPALGLRVTLPKAGAPEHLDNTRHITLTIAQNTQTYLDGKLVAPGDLPAQLQQLKAPGNHLAVIIAADKSAPMEALIGVLDTLKQAEVPAASIITDQKP